MDASELRLTKLWVVGFGTAMFAAAIAMIHAPNLVSHWSLGAVGGISYMASKILDREIKKEEAQRHE